MLWLSSDAASSEGDYLDPHSRLAGNLQNFVRQDIEREAHFEAVQGESLWQGLREQGTELWLDTGDVHAIEPLWSSHFSGLTTNNSLMNDQVQRGAYDDLIDQAGRLLQEKVPLTPAGIMATAVLRRDDVPVNMTLGFSARQNYLATALANPSFVNVFLGRVNAYVADNQLGDGQLVGEKATLASQGEVKVFARGLPESQTRQIAASLRDAKQVELLAGVDIITMPPTVAQQVRQQQPPSWNSRRNEEYQVAVAPDVSPETVRLDTLWSVSAEMRKLVEQMILTPPATPEELVQAALQQGVTDLFPQLSRDELTRLAGENKIPRHVHWQERITRGELAIDSLLTLAGLIHFARSQQALDERIERRIA
jgi:transaldolase